jgi:peptidyl-prolyl cis-trans isomerase C
MAMANRIAGVVFLWGLGLCDPSLAQPATTPSAQPAQVAATVNGQPIYEHAVRRGLKRVPESEHARARPEILNYLIDNLLIDQFLVKQNVRVEAQEVNARMEEIRKEIKQNGQDFEKILQSLGLTEAELIEQITADLRWERYTTERATESALKDLFEKNPEMFDNTLVRARHILIPLPKDAQAPTARQNALAEVNRIRKQIEDEVSAGLAKLPADIEPLQREQQRVQLLESAFARLAGEKSACPSKQDGGDLNWFPRLGVMAEPFAKTAFALKVHELSQPVETPFGYHLVLVIARKAGNPIRYEQVREEVREVYCGKLREELLAQLRPAAQVQITPPPSGGK